MIELTELSIDEWVSIYEALDDDGHLSLDGIKKLQQLKYPHIALGK